MKGRCAISFIGRVRNGLPLISRGFHGRRRAHVEVARIPPGQYAEDPGIVSPVPQSKGKDDDLETSHARGDAHRDWDHRDSREPGVCCKHPPGSLSRILFRHGSFYERYNCSPHWNRPR